MYAPVHDPLPQFTATRFALLPTLMEVAGEPKLTPWKRERDVTCQFQHKQICARTESRTPVPGVPSVEG